VVADEAYLTDSMADPQKQVVRGFQPVMPSYRGKLAPVEVAALVELIKSLRSERGAPIPAKEAAFEPAGRR
jgi:cytochrome c oxidase subunit 2